MQNIEYRRHTIHMLDIIFNFKPIIIEKIIVHFIFVPRKFLSQLNICQAMCKKNLSIYKIYVLNDFLINILLEKTSINYIVKPLTIKP